MNRPSAVFVASLAVLAACSGDDAANSSATVEPVATLVTTTSTASTTTEPAATTQATTTTVVSTTAIASTTEPTPSTSTSEPAPTTTDPDLEQIRADVAAAVITSWEAFDRVVRDPTNPDAIAALRASKTESEYQDVEDRFIVRYVLNNLAERTNPGIPASVTPYPDSLVVDQNAGTAWMDYCFVSTNLLVLIESDGSEVLQDDSVAVVLGNDQFNFVDGVWLDSGGQSRDVLDSETVCPDRQ